MRLETDRLIIRDFNQNDIEALFHIKNDTQVLEYDPSFLERDVPKGKIGQYIEKFNKIEEQQNNKDWRVYAITEKETGIVMGSLSFGEKELLHEYELGWQMMSQYTRHGYASEAAAAFSEYFCEKNNVDYLIVLMDIDNPASYRTAIKAGFCLFEKRTVYDYSYNRYCDDYYYFRRYFSKTKIQNQYYGDVAYYERHSEYQVKSHE